ncbi:MAG TPA: tripartite tricarboxylate transporter substrate binding protein [Myxococcales bacterium]|nr:tripartite tricarboxylate transporter substrate binding protein [Myxococcales bacterium]
MTRRDRSALALAFLAALLLCRGPARAEQAWPQKRPIELIVPFAPGGASDFVARIIAPPLSSELKQSIVVENRGGAAGNIGMDAAAHAAPDGYTVFLGNVGTTAINPSVFGKELRVNPQVDFVAVSKIVDVADVLVVNTGVPASTVKDFVAYAKERNGQLNFGSPGAGSQNRLETEMFMKLAGIDLLHVPYKGGAGPAVTDLIGGHTQVMFTTLASAIQFIKAGRLRALAVTLAQRVPELPDVPTMTEAGYPTMVTASWQGVFVPRGTPAPIVSQLFGAVQKVMGLAEVQQRLAAGGAVVSTSKSSEEFSAFLKAESERWGALVRERQITSN